MSDLLADAEDLLAKLGSSEIPEVRALREPVLRSIDQMKERLRDRARKQNIRQDIARPWAQTRCMHAAAATFLAVGVLTWLHHRSKQRK
jgi:hypothetical protein